MSEFATADLCDQFPDQVRILEPLFNSFGGKESFCGEIVTVKCFEDNSKVKELAGQNGKGKVMVVDGGASLRRALLGDMIAEAAVNNQWSGFVIYGCIRDSAVISTLDIGVKAINTIPLKTDKRDIGDINIPVCFAGQRIEPGHFVYADRDGIIISPEALI